VGAHFASHFTRWYFPVSRILEMGIGLCACVTGLQHAECTDSVNCVIMPRGYGLG